jgi:hypothetical protein
MAASDNSDLDRVIPLGAWFKRVGLPARSGRRLIASGDGPQLTQLTERIRGVRERHHLAWLERRKARRSQQPDSA